MTKKQKNISQAVVALGLIVLGLAGYYLLKSSREDLDRHQSEVSAPLVRAVPVRIEDRDMTITGRGTVQARTESRLVAQVGGRVVRVSDSLVNGGRFKKGERLVTIDPRDYEINVTQAEAGVKDAESQYEQARQESEAARQEWQQIHSGEKAPPLVAREPQLGAARAALEARRANLEKARLDLARTRITAPFDGRVSNKEVDPGQYVTPGQTLASVYAIDAVEIVVPLENDDLQWLDVPGFTTDARPGAPARIRARVAGRTLTWSGRVERVEGKINAQTRLVKVVVRVPRPFDTLPPLSIGQYAEVELTGRTLAGAAVIPRAALRGQSTVWAVDPDEKRLHFRAVKIARRDERGVVVREGLRAGEMVAVSPLKAPTDGMEVRIVELGRNAPVNGSSGGAGGKPAEPGAKSPADKTAEAMKNTPVKMTDDSPGDGGDS
ncbi:MAG: efflux RND transporter periplasmic adaptor subunit [Desulfosudaceae bacterium]